MPVRYWVIEPNTIIVPVEGSLADQILKQADTKKLADIINEGYALGIGDI